MFETLEPPEQSVSRRWPLLAYGTYALGGLGFLILGVRRHGFSQPFSLVIAAVMLLLSLTWLVTTLRSGTPPTNRNFGVRGIILLLLLMAHDLPSVWA
jgi:hypothetical protein